MVTVGTTVGATVPATLEHTLCNALVDTGATRSCLSEEYYQQLLLPGLKPVHKLQVRTASGSSLCPTGTVSCDFKLGKQPFSFEFIVCRGLSRPCILGLDFLGKYKIGIGWSPTGKFQLDLHQQVLVESIKVYMSGPTLQTRQCITIPSRSLMVLNAKATIDRHMEGGLHKVVPNFLLSDEYPELVLIPTVHNVEITKLECIPYVLLNLSEEAIFLRKGEILGHLEKEDITIEEITTETMLQCKDMKSEKLDCGDIIEEAFIASPVSGDTCKKVKLQDVKALSHCKMTEKVTTEAVSQCKDMESEKLNCGNESQKTFIASPAKIDTCQKVELQKAEVLSIDKNEYKETMLQSEGMENEKPRCDISSEKKFITSPADVDTHRKVKLQDAEVLDKYKIDFEKLCEEYDDIFSKDSSDIGKTPLITMEIETGDSPPVCQRPYNLPLKHVDWVQQELNTLEKAGVITRSVSPWASPIVIVPKRTAPGDPPKKRLCVDYRVINSLLPKVNKAHSKAKGVLTLVPLPKIDEIYARLKGSKVYSGFDARSGYHHMELSAKARPKSAFVTPTDKYEFTRCPFGLTQAPAYFQRLINKVLADLDFAFGYLDDILIYSPDVPTHLVHMRQLFQRLREADLKLNREKCNFFKSHIQYLGHLISGEGIKPLPEKLESIKEMPPPTTPKEVKQFLGLIGYYRKFVPRFADVARPLTNLTRLDQPFEWSDKCQASFELLKEALIKEPILRFPDPNKPYTLYTDASKYAWSCVLTQQYTHDIDNKQIVMNHPITYVSGLFKGSQLNWAALTKEAYAIYMSIKKLTYYLEDAEITLRSDHLPLKRFLQRNTLNTKVNNWAVEISPFKITFEYIKGIKNTLADTMSRLVALDPDNQLVDEPEGFEYGYYAFDNIDPIKTQVEVNEMTNKVVVTTSVDSPGEDITLPIEDNKLIELQKEDKFCKNILNMLANNKLQNKNPYYVENEVLKRFIDDNKQRFEVIVLPQTLTEPALQLAHEGLGHNGIPRTYALLRRQYYWKGLKPSVTKHVKQCTLCQKHNKQVVKYNKLHFEASPAPMKFISMDLIGEFHPPSSKGNRYALTVICMHTGFVFCIPLKTKSAEDVVRAYIDKVYSQFGGSEKVLTDNGTEFKNKLINEVCEQLGVKHKIYSPPYRPQSNGRIESFHYFLKACISKHITPQVEWDDVVPLACAAYNFLPNEHSKESPFFLMFGRDAILPLNKLLQPQVRYLGNDENILSMQALKNIYEMVAQNLKLARAKITDNINPIHTKLKEGDLVLIKDHTAKAFQPRYVGNYRIVSFKGNQVEVRKTEGGNTTWVHLTDVKYILPVDNIINKLPDYQNFGRKTKLRLNPDRIPNLHWNLSTTLNTTPTLTTQHSLIQTNLVSV